MLERREECDTYNISQDSIDKLITRIPRLVKKVIKCKGGFLTKNLFKI